MGLYRLWINASLEGYVGANISAAADLDIEVGPEALKFRGIKRKKNAEALTTEKATKLDTKNLTDATAGKWKVKGKVLDGTGGLEKTDSQTIGSQVTTTQTETVDGIKTVNEKIRTDKITRKQTESIVRSADGNIDYKKQKDYSNEKSSKITSTSEGTSSIKGVTASANASGSVFAGAKAGGKFVATIQFKNPEDNPVKSDGIMTKDPAESDGFKTLAGFGAEGSGNAGAGLDGELKIGLDDAGNFVITVAAGVTLGIGATVGCTYIVNPENLFDFLCFIYTQLRDADFDYLEFIDDAVFAAYEKISAYISSSFEDAKDAVLELQKATTNKIEKLIIASEEFFGQEESVLIANTLVKNIYTNKNDLIKMAPPKTKGQIVQNILSGIQDRKFHDKSAWSINGFNEDYENAIFEVLSWVQNQKEFKHTIVATCEEGRVSKPDNSQSIFDRQFKLLQETLDDPEDLVRLLNLKDNLPRISNQKSNRGKVKKNGLC